MKIKSKFILCFLVFAVLILPGIAVAQDYPLNNECTPPDGQSFACPWTPETNFEAISLWLWRNQNIDIRNWNVNLGEDIVPSDLIRYSGSGLRTDRFPVSQQIADEYAVMLHFGVTSGSACGIAFQYESESSFYAALLTRSDFRIEQRFGPAPLPVSVQGVPVGLMDLGSATVSGAQMLIVVQNNLYVFYVNGQRVAEFTFTPSGSGQNLAMLYSGEVCYTSLDWMAVPSAVSASGPAPSSISATNANQVQQLAALTGHGDGVTDVALSPDGQLAISGSDDASLYLWDIASRQPIRRMTGHTAPVESVAFSPDGQTVLSGGTDNTLILWNVNTGEAIRRFNGHGAIVESVAYSPDGRTLLSGSSDQILILWDRDTGQIIRQIQANANGIEGVAYSPGGLTVLSGGFDQTAILWDVSTGQAIQQFVGHTAEVESVAYSPNGQMIVTSSGDNTLILWDINTGNAIRTFQGHQNQVESVAFSPNGELIASSSQDNTIILWETATGARLQTLMGHSGRIDSVEFSQDRQMLISASADRTVRLWGIPGN